MKIGDYVLGGGGVTIYSPEFPRGGLGAIFTLSSLQKLGSPSLVVGLEHRNADDTAFTSLGSFTAITTLGNFTKDVGSVKEIVRFAYTTTALNDWEGFLINVTAPAWRPNA